MLKHPVHLLAFPLPYMGMDPINFPQYMEFKQTSCKLQEIYGMHAHLR